MRGDTLNECADAILSESPVSPEAGDCLGTSREGRPIRAFRLGSGPVRVSLVGGCHADEPVGPRLLARLVTFLGSLEADHTLLRDYQWWIVPHINPDGRERNRGWQGEDGLVSPSDVYDPVRYLSGAVRELPGDDLEFGFPSVGEELEVRPEARAVYEWWRSGEAPFHLHATLHGIAFAGGPWFLLEPAWLDRVEHVKRCCSAETHRLGYVLHDVDRGGEKGFHRIERGFCTRPNSVAMRDYFLALNDRSTASRFRPSSMEAIRSLGGDPLTVVSEMPLFITPGVGEDPGPPDRTAERWKERRARWQMALADARALSPEERERTSAEIRASGLTPMPIPDQMRLQWRLVSSAVEQVVLEIKRARPRPRRERS